MHNPANHRARGRAGHRSAQGARGRGSPPAASRARTLRTVAAIGIIDRREYQRGHRAADRRAVRALPRDRYRISERDGASIAAGHRTRSVRDRRCAIRREVGEIRRMLHGLRTRVIADGERGRQQGRRESLVLAVSEPSMASRSFPERLAPLIVLELQRDCHIVVLPCDEFKKQFRASVTVNIDVIKVRHAWI